MQMCNQPPTSWPAVLRHIAQSRDGNPVTHAEIARLIGVHQTTVMRIARGLEPRAGVGLKLLEMAGVPLSIPGEFLCDGGQLQRRELAANEPSDGQEAA